MKSFQKKYFLFEIKIGKPYVCKKINNNVDDYLNQLVNFNKHK